MSINWSHVGLGVTDLERSREFYENVLGFKHKTTIEVEGTELASLMRLPTPCKVRVMMLDKSGFTLELMQVVEPEMQPFRERVLNEPGLTHLNIRVDENMAAVREKVEQYGGTILPETVQPIIEGRLAALSEATYVRDPDGQLLELINDVRTADGAARDFSPDQ